MLKIVTSMKGSLFVKTHFVLRLHTDTRIKCTVGLKPLVLEGGINSKSIQCHNALWCLVVLFLVSLNESYGYKTQHFRKINSHQSQQIIPISRKIKSQQYAIIPKTLQCNSHSSSIGGTTSSTGDEKWKGEGMSQEDFMYQDYCIRVDENDNIVGKCTKRDAHVFNDENPRGYLHRAFSIFLFNTEGHLLLQRRATDKITFPGVWTNTCCSHPLYGCTPSEVDLSPAVNDRTVPGIRAAAIRKLHHELGIPVDTILPQDFKILTRIIYCAADRYRGGGDGDVHPAGEITWGEHELDYILFVRADIQQSSSLSSSSGLLLDPNPEEVCDVKYVSPAELRNMMGPDSGLEWSPWFRLMADRFLFRWWDNLDNIINMNLDLDNIMNMNLDLDNIMNMNLDLDNIMNMNMNLDLTKRDTETCNGSGNGSGSGNGTMTGDRQSD
eukprot:gene3401-6753_t